ncbi:MAG TPA: Cro/Cl family transcriptional regulator, partial [Erwinia sp.]|uniref:ornithine cyclodeaminase family protein n=1 Tax=Erwinia citreus TaxID=558 RepID=UPI000E96BAC8
MRYFDRESVEQTLSPEIALQLSYEAFALVSQGKIEQTLRSVIAADDGRLMGTMPAYIKTGPYAGFGLKTVKVDFSQPGHASHEGAILLYDASANGEMAVVDAGAITELRTAAASALATKLLSPPDASHLAMLGTGVQARRHLEMLLTVRPIRRITLWGRNRENTARLADWCSGYNLKVTLADTPAQAVREAEIICTVTAAKAPFLHRQDLPPRCHINAVGASAQGFQELAADVYSAV